MHFKEATVSKPPSHNTYTVRISIASRGRLPKTGFYCYGAPMTVFPLQRFNDGASTIVILMILMLGQCMLSDRASEDDLCNDCTSDGV